MKQLLIAGLSGFGFEAATMFRESGRYSSIGFVGKTDDGATEVFGFPVVGTDDDLVTLRERYEDCFVAIGKPSVRSRVTNLVEAAGFELASLVHARAYVSPGVAVTPGTIIYPNATIMAGCVMGRGCLVNTNASIGHETVLGHFVNVNPGANVAGRVIVGDGTHIGIGAVVLENRRIGHGAMIGGGAVVIRDVAPEVTVVGVPAAVRT